MPRTPMRIIDTQRRLVEVGRLRTGKRTHVRTERKNGKTVEITKPERLERFRFTTRLKRAAAAIAATYGGEVQEWEGAPGAAKQWEVYCEADELEVLVPPNDMAFSQAYELWSGGGCQRRCDGIREYISERACICADEQDAGAERQCKPHSRLNVMLPHLGPFGLWRLETSGYNARDELLGSIEVCQMAAQAGQLPRAKLWIDLRTGQRPKARGEGTITVHYNVPVLEPDIDFGPRGELTTAARPELGPADGDGEAGGPSPVTPVDPDKLPPGPQPSVREQVEEPVPEPPSKPHKGAQEPLRSTGRRPRPAEGQPQPSEGEATPPPAKDPEEATDDAAAKERASNIAQACNRAGLDDDGRHRFLSAASGGAYDSAKRVPAEHVAQIMAGLVKLRKGTLELVEQGGQWRLIEAGAGDDTPPEPDEQPTLDVASTERPVEDTPPPEPKPPAEAEEDASPDDGEVRDRAWWRRQWTPITGVGEAKVLRKAREVAAELGEEQPRSMDEITHPQVGHQVMVWLKEQAQQ